MRINRNLALDCPMTAQILNSESRKKTELIIRLAETQLKALGYSPNHFRTKEDIKFVIEMMDRGFILGGSPYGSRGRSEAAGSVKKKPPGQRKKKFAEDSTLSSVDKREEGSTGVNNETGDDGYLDMIRGALGDDEFGSMAGREV